MKIKPQAIAVIACGILFTPAVYAGDKGAHWTNPDGDVYKNADGECWKTPDWTEADAIRECDPDLVPKPEPKVAAPAPKPVTPPPEPEPVFAPIYLSADTLFAFDSSEIKPEGKSTISDLAQRMKNLKKETVDIAGHTDSVGSEEYNQGLSEERATSVKKALVKEGVPADMITTRGYGETAPVASNDTDQGRALNRRVDISINAVKKVSQ